mgnify:CR=1 FL=1
MDPPFFIILAYDPIELSIPCLQRRDLQHEPVTIITVVTLDHKFLRSSYLTADGSPTDDRCRYLRNISSRNQTALSLETVYCLICHFKSSSESVSSKNQSASQSKLLKISPDLPGLSCSGCTFVKYSSAHFTGLQPGKGSE